MPQYRPRYTATDNADVQGVQSATRAKFRKLDAAISSPLGDVTERVTGRYQARFDELVVCDPSAGGFAVILPSIAPSSRNRIVSIKNVTSSTNTITIYPSSSSELIDGASSAVIETAYGGVCIICDGINWIIAYTNGGGGVGSVITTDAYYWDHIQPEYLPTGVTAANVKAHHILDGSAGYLNDLSGNGNTLSVLSYSESARTDAVISYTAQGLKGTMFDGNLLLRAAADASYQITDNVTLEAQVNIFQGPAFGDRRGILLCGYYGTGASYAEPWGLDLLASSSPDRTRTVVHSQDSSGTFDYSILTGYPPFREIVYIVATLDDSSPHNCNFYFNGEHVGSDTVVRVTAGASTRLVIGSMCEHAYDGGFIGMIYSTRVLNVKLSLAQIQEVYGMMFKPREDLVSE